MCNKEKYITLSLYEFYRTVGRTDITTGVKKYMSHIRVEKQRVISTREKIFRAAAHLFAEKGFSGVSMREISEATALSKPTIYYYFGNKQGVYAALVEAGIHYQNDKFSQIMEMAIPVKQKIIELIKMRFQQVLEYPEMAKFFLILIMTPEKLSFLDRLIQEADFRRRRFADLIRAGIVNGEFGRSADPELAAEIIFGSVMQFIIKQLNEPRKILDEQLAERIVEFIFKGLNE